MKFRFTVAFLVFGLFTLTATLMAGHYVKNDASIYLDGKVLIKFDHLQFGWSKDEKSIDKIRYMVRCLKGNAVLNNVDYLDTAVQEKESVRWAQSEKPLGLDISSKFSHLDKAHRIQFSHQGHTNVSPYNLATAKVRFHIFASGRNFQVIWKPKTGEISSTW